MPITVGDIVRALSDLGGEGSVEEIHARVLEIAKPPISVHSRQIVRGRLQDYCPESGAYRHKAALFASVHGLDQKAGLWRLLTPEIKVANRSKASDGRRNPAWSRDELILALDLYMTNPANPPGKASRAVTELSDLLNRLHQLSGKSAAATLRNPNGVYLKMMNIRSLDPRFIAQGKVGMVAGGHLDKVVWAEYYNRRAALAADAAMIRQAIVKADQAANSPSHDGDHEYEGAEGGIIIHLHRSRERDTKLIAKKKAQAKAAGKLHCEVCTFNFATRYGELGIDYIEVHHVNPIALMEPGAKTKLTDLALLCSNCHRMAHRRRLPLSLDELRTTLAAPRDLV